MNKLKLEYLKCIKSTNIYFKKRKKYPIISYNNGIKVMGEINKQTGEHQTTGLLFDHDDGIYDETKAVVFK